MPLWRMISRDDSVRAVSFGFGARLYTNSPLASPPSVGMISKSQGRKGWFNGGSDSRLRPPVVVVDHNRPSPKHNAPHIVLRYKKQSHPARQRCQQAPPNPAGVLAHLNVFCQDPRIRGTTEKDCFVVMGLQVYPLSAIILFCCLGGDLLLSIIDYYLLLIIDCVIASYIANEPSHGQTTSKLGWNSRFCGWTRIIGYIGINWNQLCYCIAPIKFQKVPLRKKPKGKGRKEKGRLLTYSGLIRAYSGLRLIPGTVIPLFRGHEPIMVV